MPTFRCVKQRSPRIYHRFFAALPQASPWDAFLKKKNRCTHIAVPIIPRGSSGTVTFTFEKPYVQPKKCFGKMLLVVEKLFAGDTVSCMWSSRRAVYGFTRLLPQRGMQKMSKNKLIDLNNITVSFDGETVLDNLSLSIQDGEFVTLLGASGCGKTTTLRIIAGFIEPDSGDVFFDGKRINGVPPYKRHINTIFQRYALFPNYNVYDNVAFGLRVSKVPEAEILERYSRIVASIREALPETKLYCISLIPQNKQLEEYTDIDVDSTTAAILQINPKICRIAEDAGGVYVDLFPLLADEEHFLLPEYSDDGIHLNETGLAVWTAQMLPLLKENEEAIQ